MMAPEEFSRNRKTRSGETYAAMTQAKPTTVEVRMAHIGTPRLLIDSIRAGASLRADSTNSIRDAVYSPEFRQDSTAVRTTTFMKSAAPGMPICSMAATYGDSPRRAEFHGRIVASRKFDPTEKMDTRISTELVPFASPLFFFRHLTALRV